MKRRTQDRGRRLIASVGHVFYWPRSGWNCLPRSKSNIEDYLVCFEIKKPDYDRLLLKALAEMTLKF